MVRQLHDPCIRGFASDNQAGAHPEVVAALDAANGGHQSSYGADVHTARLAELVTDQFGPQAVAYPVFNGTGANLICLQSIVPRWGSVICPVSAHINTDEAGAPEQLAGIKLITVPTRDGKLTVDDLYAHTPEPGDVHHPLPVAVSITQASELGTIYCRDELAALTECAHRMGLAVHMDGARIANAAARLGVGLKELTTDVGVDVVSFGGTKNGLLFGELVLVLNPAAVNEADRLRKISTQLASKMRFISAQFVTMLDGELWRRSAGHANRMATRLRALVQERIDDGRLPGVAFTQSTDANIIFATLPEGVADRLRQRFAFHDWDASVGEVRWVCSFDTTEDDIEALVSALEAEVGSNPGQEVADA